MCLSEDTKKFIREIVEERIFHTILKLVYDKKLDSSFIGAERNDIISLLGLDNTNFLLYDMTKEELVKFLINRLSGYKYDRNPFRKI